MTQTRGLTNGQVVKTYANGYDNCSNGQESLSACGGMLYSYRLPLAVRTGVDSPAYLINGDKSTHTSHVNDARSGLKPHVTISFSAWPFDLLEMLRTKKGVTEIPATSPNKMGGRYCADLMTARLPTLIGLADCC